MARWTTRLCSAPASGTSEQQESAIVTSCLRWAVLAFVSTLGGAEAAAQNRHERAPAPDESLWVDGYDVPPAVRLAQSTEAIGRPAVLDPPTTSAGPPGAPAERGIFQGVELKANWLPRLDDDGLGHSTLSAGVSFGVPPLLLGMPLLVTPRAGLHLLDGPSFIDTASTLNDFDVSFASFKAINDRWSFRGSVSIGVYGDDYSLDESEALRMSGFAAALYQTSPEWQWMFGAAYLNRDDLSVIPVVGFIRDCGSVRYEVMMPRPRIVWRLPQDAAGAERSVYLAGDLGGGAWAVRRADGSTDTLNLSSWGVGVGYETNAGPGSWLAGKRRYELGYVFGRHLEYSSDRLELPLDDSLVVRMGWNY